MIDWDIYIALLLRVQEPFWKKGEDSQKQIVVEDQSKAVSYGDGKIAAVMNGSSCGCSGPTHRSTQSVFEHRRGVSHESPPLTEERLTVDGFW